MKVQKIRFAFTYDDGDECKGSRPRTGHEIGVIIPATKECPEILWVKRYVNYGGQLFALVSEDKNGTLEYKAIEGSTQSDPCAENRKEIEILAEIEVPNEMIRSIRNHVVSKPKSLEANKFIYNLVYPDESMHARAY